MEQGPESSKATVSSHEGRLFSRLKRILYLDLGVPGRIFEWSVKAVVVFAIGGEIIHSFLVGWNSLNRTPRRIPTLHDIVCDASDRWQLKGDILGIEYEQVSMPAAIELPFHCNEKDYSLRFRLKLWSKQSDLRLVFPVGSTRSAVIFNLKELNGLGLTTCPVWECNPTGGGASCHFGEWDEVKVTIRSALQRANVTVALNGVPIVMWSGEQADLSTVPERNEPPSSPSSLAPFVQATLSGRVAIEKMR